jgi:hypothetical protein
MVSLSWGPRWRRPPALSLVLIFEITFTGKIHSKLPSIVYLTWVRRGAAEHGRAAEPLMPARACRGARQSSAVAGKVSPAEQAVQRRPRQRATAEGGRGGCAVRSCSPQCAAGRAAPAARGRAAPQHGDLAALPQQLLLQVVKLLVRQHRLLVIVERLRHPGSRVRRSERGPHCQDRQPGMRSHMHSAG